MPTLRRREGRRQGFYKAEKIRISPHKKILDLTAVSLSVSGGISVFYPYFLSIFTFLFLSFLVVYLFLLSPSNCLSLLRKPYIYIYTRNLRFLHYITKRLTISVFDHEYITQKVPQSCEDIKKLSNRQNSFKGSILDFILYLYEYNAKSNQVTFAFHEMDRVYFIIISLWIPELCHVIKCRMEGKPENTMTLAKAWKICCFSGCWNSRHCHVLETKKHSVPYISFLFLVTLWKVNALTLPSTMHLWEEQNVMLQNSLQFILTL